MPSMESSTPILFRDQNLTRNLSFLSSFSPHCKQTLPLCHTTLFPAPLLLIIRVASAGSSSSELPRSRCFSPALSFRLAAAGPRSSSVKPRCPRIC
ncbi:hypothetical protein Syun_023228 [Stephania yunnanensis]|uniref:Uncharacterized protein n=1 Tax=Stephania yunnanensis TaxID=152371 RepID=A0AAP0I246_9MAGN